LDIVKYLIRMASASAKTLDYVELSDGQGTIFNKTYTQEDTIHNHTVYESLELEFKKLLEKLELQVYTMKALEQKQIPKVKILKKQQDINKAQKIGRDIEWFCNYILRHPSIHNLHDVLSTFLEKLKEIQDKNKNLEQVKADTAAFELLAMNSNQTKSKKKSKAPAIVNITKTKKNTRASARPISVNGTGSKENEIGSKKMKLGLKKMKLGLKKMKLGLKKMKLGLKKMNLKKMNLPACQLIRYLKKNCHIIITRLVQYQQ